ncbi:TPA: helix-turn-helix transcriptional regulator [Klebsiella pneumoniae]|uniref:S24 family peptidase n=1 Tax=Klebsiella TaxID=570 RepID=UPI0029599CD1|nr:S24 family peptidase [Klebsiella pneumoniae]HCQ8472425.1 helix-turn-helix transcriptional regulator [Klebsiella michiganensis]EIV3096866.1 helix-turn-helix transcriptional regulator [Klebsiella pneumoniae]MDX7518393.1 S24 family peptidase [Klebsiella pneumoniae]MEB2926747.1 S24 family peptidase [Klebsiella pneumoniae]HBY9004605.1 helix-turn-helix transcriptional regulator [Klebsiella pneumoniae]
MVKKDDLKEEFSKRLRAALLDAGVGGRGQAKRIREAMKSQGVAVSEPGIWKWLNASAIPDQTNILALSRWLGVRPDWLEYGRNEPKPEILRESSIPPESEWGTVDAWDKNTPLPDDEVEVPFLKDIEFACGNGRVQDEDHNGFKLRFSKATLRRVGANTDGTGVLCFPAVGNSMEPFIPDGATVAINCNDKRIVDGKIYAVNQDGWKRLKMLYRVGPDRVSLRSYNSQEHPDEEHPLSDIEIVGRMFWSSMLW